MSEEEIVPREIVEFENPRRFIVGTIGLPGEREFFVQIKGETRLISIALEKGQARVLAEGLDRLLDELHRNGFNVPMHAPGDLDLEPLELPVEARFHAQSMGLGWNEDFQMLTLELHAPSEHEFVPEVDENTTEGPAKKVDL